MEKLHKLLKNMDWLFLGLFLIILIYNLIILKSASANVVDGQPYYYVLRQLVWMLVGLVLMVAVALVDYHQYEKLYKYFYIAINLLLILVLFLPEQKGAHRWIDLKIIDLQPSELAKVVMIIALACFLASREGEMNLLRNLGQAVAYMALPFILVLIEPDLGTSLVFIVIFLAMLWVGGVPPKIIIAVVLIGVILVLALFGFLYFATDGFTRAPEDGDLPAWIPLKGYQLTRLIIFVNPYMDPLDAGYHMIQSEVAIGSGGLTGKGYGLGSQVQGGFLPEHHTDFIFSVVGEELGVVGALAVLLLYFGLLARGLYIAYQAKDVLGTTIVTGVIAMFFFQVFVNAGMTIGVMPITGLPFPFLSYGGSGMMVNMIAMGLVFSVVLRRRSVLF